MPALDWVVAEWVLSPAIPPLWIAVLAGLLLVLVLLGLARRVRGMPARALAAALLLVVLAGPALRVEQREVLPDVAFLVVDGSGSQTLSSRDAESRSAASRLEPALREQGIEVRTLRVGEPAASRVLGPLRDAAREVDPARIAGAVLLSDGLVDDPDALDSFPGPVHMLLSGGEAEFDRRLQLLRSPVFGIVGEAAELELVIRDEIGGEAPQPGVLSEPVEVEIRVHGGTVQRLTARPGETQRVALPVTRAGSVPVEVRVPVVAGEITGRNNSAAFTIEGIRDRLQVLLVSGSPHPAARVWRNLLRSDPAVDLVHFTILRLAESVEPASNEELSLIDFPVRRLFVDEIDRFDLIIFDRYQRRGFLPEDHFESIVRYVRDGGAVLVAGGGEWAGAQGFSGGVLDSVLPLIPTGVEQVTAYVPEVTDLGRRHPVTAGLTAALDQAGPWYRLAQSRLRSGQLLLTGHDGVPVLALDRVESGRIGVLASEHAWLWSRGHRGGGPHRELFRRIAHWLMREPDLEEESLQAREEDGQLVVLRRSLAEGPAEIRLRDPDGRDLPLEMIRVAPGLWRGVVEEPDPGLYRATSGELGTLAIIGGGGREFDSVIATDARLRKLVEGTGGSVRRLASGDPRVDRVAAGGPMAGSDWIGLPRRGAHRVLGTELRPLLPPWLALLLVLAALAVAWWREAGAGWRDRFEVLRRELPLGRRVGPGRSEE